MLTTKEWTLIEDKFMPRQKIKDTYVVSYVDDETGCYVIQWSKKDYKECLFYLSQVNEFLKGEPYYIDNIYVAKQYIVMHEQVLKMNGVRFDHIDWDYVESELM